MVTRDLSNARITVGLSPISGVADPTLQTVALAEAQAFLNISPAIRWSGWTMAAQASDKVADRSVADQPGAIIRGFNKFGGALPLFVPKITDTSSILRQAFNTTKTQRTSLLYLERVGWANFSDAFAAGDTINIYSVLTDGFEWSTAGSNGYAYLLTLLAAGYSNFWYVLGAATPASLTLVGSATGTVSLASNSVLLRGVTYYGQDITPRATWTSSNPAVATVRDGVIVPVSVGTATIVPSYPGAAVSTGISVTVSA